MARELKSTATPKLRFPEFRNADGWRETKLGSIVTILKGKGIAKSDVVPDGTRACIRYGELYTRYGEVIGTVHSRTNAPASDLLLSVKNDVIIPASGETKLDIAKASCVLLGDVALGSDLNVLRSDNNGVFLSYLLNGSKRHEIAKVAQGDAVVHLYPSQLQEILVALPAPKEQQKIADCLKALDDVIAGQRQKIEGLKVHRRGLLRQLFPRDGETVPHLRFPEFRHACDWSLVPLGTLLVGKPEYGVNAGAVPYSRQLPTYLRITDIDEDGQFLSQGKASVDIDATDDNYMRDGDIALARTGASVGKSYRYRTDDGPLVFAGFLIRIRPNRAKIVSGFLSSFLMTRRYWDWVRITSARSGQPGINGSEFAALPVPVPPPSASGSDLAEQLRIADCFSSLDSQIVAQSDRLATLKGYKMGLGQQLFPSKDGAE
jgi:restriction endonuclease S subunit